MTDYFVGPGGNNGNSGTSYGARRATITSGITLLSAGDRLIAAAGEYPENPTFAASGSSGSPLTIIGDVSGQLTDGVGGRVIITGSDNGQTAARATCISWGSQDWWVVRGLTFLGANGDLVAGLSDNNIIEQCYFFADVSGDDGITINSDGSNNIIRRCFFSGGAGITKNSGSGTGDLFENCIFAGAPSHAITMSGSTAKARHCTFIVSGGDGYRAITASTSGHEIYNSLFFCGNVGARGMSGGGNITEDYNNFDATTTPRVNVTAGSNSLAYRVALGHRHELLMSGLRDHACQSSEVPTVDFWGNPRLQSASNIADWGAVQHPGIWTPSGTAAGGSRSSQVTGVGFKHSRAKRADDDYTVAVQCRVTSGSGTPRPYLELVDGDGTVVDSMTATSDSESDWEELGVTMPGGTLIPYIVRMVNPNNALTVLWDRAA